MSFIVVLALFHLLTVFSDVLDKSWHRVAVYNQEIFFRLDECRGEPGIERIYIERAELLSCPDVSEAMNSIGYSPAVTPVYETCMLSSVADNDEKSSSSMETSV